MNTVIIDGVTYRPSTERETRADHLLREVYGALWTEAYYDPDNEETRTFALRWVGLMKEANDILGFKS